MLPGLLSIYHRFAKGYLPMLAYLPCSSACHHTQVRQAKTFQALGITLAEIPQIHQPMLCTHLPAITTKHSKAATLVYRSGKY
jgi:hypothetical protein